MLITHVDQTVCAHGTDLHVKQDFLLFSGDIIMWAQPAFNFTLHAHGNTRKVLTLLPVSDTRESRSVSLYLYTHVPLLLLQFFSKQLQSNFGQNRRLSAVITQQQHTLWL